MRNEFTPPGYERLQLTDRIFLWLPESLRAFSHGSIPARRPTEPTGGALSDPVFAARVLPLIERN